MIDVSTLVTLVKSGTFGGRNANKVFGENNGIDDRGRIAATAGQLTNAGKAAAKLDNTLGKGAQAAINAMSSASEHSRILRYANKSASWASDHVNPLLVGAAGYRILVSDDKEAQLKKEVFGMSSMFGVEALMKNFLNSDYLKEVHSKMTNKYAKTALAVIEGLGFVAGSIAASTAGYKVGELYVEKTRNTNKNNLTTDLNNSNKEIINSNNKTENLQSLQNYEENLELENKLLQKELLA